MDVMEVVQGARDALNVKRVYGEPYERDCVTVIPAASFGGGGGGGGDNEANGGSGFALRGRPVGAYVIHNGEVRWQPAVDITFLSLIALAGLLVLRGMLPWRSRRRRKR